MEEVPLNDDEVVVYMSMSDEDSTDNKNRKRDQEVLQQYEFMQDDVIDLVSSYDEEADKNFIEDDDVDANALMLEHGLVSDEKADMREAMTILYDGRWEEFLELPVIHNKFGPAFSLIQHFGIGKGTKNVKYLWELLWQERLVIDSNRSQRPAECIACSNERCCGYQLSERSIVKGLAKVSKLGFMGPHCYEIRFRPLRNLVDQCLLLPLFLNDEIFDAMVQKCLNSCLEDIIEANELMEDMYSNRKLKPKKRSKLQLLDWQP